VPAFRHLVAATAVLAALAAPAAAAGSALRVTGNGNAILRASGPATAWAVSVAGGRIRLIADDGSSLRLLCVRPIPGRRCVRRTPLGGYVVLRPVKFLYNGTGPFQLAILHARRFDLNVLGSGRMRLNGIGTYTLDGILRGYTGLTLFRL
jgi:hypothetical protein